MYRIFMVQYFMYRIAVCSVQISKCSVQNLKGEYIMKFVGYTEFRENMSAFISGVLEDPILLSSRHSRLPSVVIMGASEYERLSGPNEGFGEGFAEGRRVDRGGREKGVSEHLLMRFKRLKRIDSPGSNGLSDKRKVITQTELDPGEHQLHKIRVTDLYKSSQDDSQKNIDSTITSSDVLTYVSLVNDVEIDVKSDIHISFDDKKPALPRSVFLSQSVPVASGDATVTLSGDSVYSHTASRETAAVCLRSIIDEDLNLVKQNILEHDVLYRTVAQEQQVSPNDHGDVIGCVDASDTTEIVEGVPCNDTRGIGEGWAQELVGSALIRDLFAAYPVYDSEDINILNHFLRIHPEFSGDHALKVLSQVVSKSFSPKTWCGLLPWLISVVEESTSAKTSPTPTSSPTRRRQKKKKYGLDDNIGCELWDVRYHDKHMTHPFFYVPRSYEHFQALYDETWGFHDPIEIAHLSYMYVPCHMMKRAVQVLGIDMPIEP